LLKGGSRASEHPQPHINRNHFLHSIMCTKMLQAHVTYFCILSIVVADSVADLEGTVGNRAAELVGQSTTDVEFSLMQMKMDLELAKTPSAQANSQVHSSQDVFASRTLSQKEKETDPKDQTDEEFEKDYIIDGDPQPGMKPTPSPASIAWIHLEKPEFLKDVNMQAVFAEYLAMTLFVTIGCGSAMGVAKTPGWILQVALTFGFAITVLGYAIGHYSGGHINCAVTFGLYLAGEVEWFQGVCILLAQLLGSITGAALLSCMYPKDKDLTGALASNAVNEGYSVVHAFLGEVMMTFLLVFVVLETAIDPATKASRLVACLAIGLAVFLAHSVLIPVDGCSINPTRSFGPAILAAYSQNKSLKAFQDLWIFWLGPLLGAAAAVGAYDLFG